MTILTEKEEKKIKGVVSTIRYRSHDGWSVFSIAVETEDEQFPLTINCTGSLADSIQIGDNVTCTGSTVKNKQYGDQLKCYFVIPEAPDVNSEEGVLKLLTRLPGIGTKKAEIAVKKFGANKAWNYALNKPAIIGVREEDSVAAMEIAKALVNDYEALVFFLGVGLTDSQSAKILKRFGEKSIEVVRNEPYRLIKDIDGFGFMIVDGIALKAGIPPQAPARIMACVSYLLESSENDGHTYFHGKRLCAMGADFLIESAKQHQVPLNKMPGYEEIRAAIYQLQEEGFVKIDDGRVFSTRLKNSEQIIYNALQQ